MRRFFSYFLLFLFSFQALAQTELSEFEQLVKDSAHVSVYNFIKRVADLNPDNKNLLATRLQYKAMLNEWDDMCRYISEAKLKGMHVPPYYQFYDKIHCSGNVKGMPKEIQYMYQQKGQTEENGYKSVFTKKDSLRGTLNKWRSCYDVTFYDLKVRFDTKKHSIVGTNTIHFRLDSVTHRIQIDKHIGLVIDSVMWGRKRTNMITMLEESVFYIPLPTTMKAGDTASVTIYYHGKPPKAKNPPWEGGFVWKRKSYSKVWAGVACEHLGASVWWPCKDHPSDEPDSMRMQFEVPQPFKVVSNGRLIKEEKLADKYGRFTWKVSNPINTYNATFYIGTFKSYSEKYVDINGNSHDLKFYYLPPNESKAKKYFPLSLEVLHSYESLFGEYPFWSDGYALVESPFAGMEHQSAVAIGSGYGNAEHNKGMYRKVKDDYLIIHESAHEWWGNSVTANDMADAWLQEGFATFAEMLYIEQKFGPQTYVEELDYKRGFALNLWPLLGNRGVNDNAFIGSDIYYKGALLLQNIRFCVDNDSVFFYLLKSFAIKYKYKTVSTEDFVQHVKEVSGKDLSPVFMAYLQQTQVPTLVYYYYKQDNDLLLKCKWRHVPKGFLMPFAIKRSDGKYERFEVGTEVKTIVIKEAKFFNFLNNQINLRDCPPSYYGYFNTQLEPSVFQ